MMKKQWDIWLIYIRVLNIICCILFLSLSIILHESSCYFWKIGYNHIFPSINHALDRIRHKDSITHAMSQIINLVLTCHMDILHHKIYIKRVQQFSIHVLLNTNVMSTVAFDRKIVLCFSRLTVGKNITFSGCTFISMVVLDGSDYQHLVSLRFICPLLVKHIRTFT